MYKKCLAWLIMKLEMRDRANMMSRKLQMSNTRNEIVVVDGVGDRVARHAIASAVKLWMIE